ncbi:MAG: hypothetical protein K6B28_03595 [Lachnospiraceae bacterium]|nr:hypothetical protein [Lachnospiraceae bacterium]
MNEFKVSKGIADEYGASVSEAGINFCFASSCCTTVFLCLYGKDHKLIKKIDMLPYKDVGDTYSVCISGMAPEDVFYTYEVDGRVTEDRYEKNALRLRKWGESRRSGKINLSAIYTDDFDWGDDRPLNIPYEEVIAYELHVRGYTRHSSLKTVHRGTYLGLTEKTDHFREISVNQLILMPAYDFDEIDENKRTEFLKEGDDPERINYWGFKAAAYFMPKPEFSYSDDFVNEFKTMVKSMHAAGIEVIMRFYFPDSVNRNLIIPCLKHWVIRYHIDGFFLMGEDIPMDLIATEPVLCNSKIYYRAFNKETIFGKKYENVNRCLAKADDSFMNIARRFLKSDEDMLAAFTEANRYNPSDIRRINYITSYEGFTLNDLVSYDYKHNEANGEGNRDGTDYNYSWNCGYEGMSRKKSVRELRLKQMKNALMMLFLSRGVPVMLEGDEFMNTRGGNNNPYCQDNEISWVKRRSNREAEEFFDFVKRLSKLRREHPILHMSHEPGLIDSLSCGYPDLSYHSENAWYPRFSNHVRNVGVMYCGLYEKKKDGESDDFFYAGYNMHWEDHKYALPKLPEGLCWSLELSSDRGAYDDYKDQLLTVNDSIVIHQRSIILLRSSKAKAGKKTSERKTEKSVRR